MRGSMTSTTRRRGGRGGSLALTLTLVVGLLCCRVSHGLLPQGGAVSPPLVVARSRVVVASSEYAAAAAAGRRRGLGGRERQSAPRPRPRGGGVVVVALSEDGDNAAGRKQSAPVPIIDALSDDGDDDDDGTGRRSFLASASAAVAAAALGSVPQAASAATATASAAAAANVAAATTGVGVIAIPPANPDLYWPLGKVAFSLLPLAGTSTRRATVQDTLVPDAMWTHDQLQGVVNVNVPVRQTVVKLSREAGGGLWVYNPVAPTKQVLKMMRELERVHGPVRHIVLGTVALEHKATLGPFAQNFPDATVWLQPGQWAFPVGLPIEFLGVTQRRRRLREIPTSDDPNTVSRQYRYYAKRDPVPEWACDFEHETLGPLKFQSVGSFSETAFFHKSTKTLLVTDTVVSVTDDPPPIIREDPRAMLFHARDSIEEIVVDDEQTRRRGWRRMVQFGLVFFPSQIDVVPVGKAISQANKVQKSMKPLGEDAVPFSLYPWTWHDNDADAKNFAAISRGGALFCPPILTKLILDREPVATLAWVDRVASRFDFERVVPCHLNNNVKANPDEFRAAFDVLTSDPVSGKLRSQRPLGEDLALLQKASDLLTDVGVVGPSGVCDGEPARVEGRFASKKRR